MSEICLQFLYSGEGASDVGVLTGKRSVLLMCIFKSKRELNTYEKSQKSIKYSEDLVYKLDSLGNFRDTMFVQIAALKAVDTLH